MFFEDYTEKVWGIHPSQLGADWGSQRVKGLSLLKVLTHVFKKAFSSKHSLEQKGEETSLIEQFIYPKLGPGQLWETVASEIQQKGGEVIKQNKVIRIHVANNRVIAVETQHEDKIQTIPCDYLFSSMPIKDLIPALSGIEVPQEVKQIAENLPYRDFITVGLLVNKLNIKNQTNIKTYQERVPDTWIYIQERDVKIGRLQIFNNWSPYMVREPLRKVWIGLEYFCSEGDELWRMDDREFIHFAAKELEKIGVIEADSITSSIRIKVKKAYPAYFGSYENFGLIRNWLDTISNLYCIGRNGQHRYNNMDHSMLSAMCAANLIGSGSDDKSRLWDINTEAEYHEAG